MSLSDFRQFAKEEFIYVGRSYFMPVTFLWVLCTKGWTAAKGHVVEIWNSDSPIVKRSRSE